MLDQHGELIYVGKAKSLRRRLLSYFRTKSRDRKAGKIIGQAKTIVWEVQPSEFGACWRAGADPAGGRAECPVPTAAQPHDVRLFGPASGAVCVSRPSSASRRPRLVWPLPAHRRTFNAIRRVNDLFCDRPQKQEMHFPEQAELFPQIRAPGCLRMEIGAGRVPV